MLVVRGCQSVASDLLHVRDTSRAKARSMHCPASASLPVPRRPAHLEGKEDPQCSRGSDASWL